MVPDPPPPLMQPDTDQSDTSYGSLDHQSPIHAVAFSPDGQTLASLGEDSGASSIKLWDPHTQQLKDTIRLSPEVTARWLLYRPEGELSSVVGPETLPRFVTGPMSLVRAVAYSSDRLSVATGSSDKTVRVWDLPTGAHRFTLEHEGQVWSVAFSPDGQTLATGGGFEGIYLWDAITGESKGDPFIANTAQVEGLAFGPDGHTLFVATGRGDGEAIHVWDLNTNTHIDTLMAVGYTIRKVAVSPDGQLIAGGAYYSEAGPGVVLWEQE